MVPRTLVTLLFGAALSAAPYYHFYDLNTIQASMHARVLNNAGQAAGYWFNGEFGVFLYTPGLGAVPIGSGDVTGMNNLGQVVGNTSVAGGGQFGFLYSPSTGQQILFPGAYSSYATDINDSGQVTGTYAIGDSNSYESFGFIRQANGTTAVLPPGATPFVINSGGTVGGAYDVPGTSPRETHAFLYDPANGLLDLGATTYQVTGINSLGQAVGRYYGPVGGLSFFYQPGVGLIYMPDLLGFDAYPTAINNLGQIVGMRYSDYRGFVYTPGSGVVFLDTTIPRSYGLTWLVPGDINDAGQLLVSERYIFTPSDTPMPDIPEPATWSLVLIGLAAAILKRRRQLI